MTDYAKIHQYLIDNPEEALNSVARRFAVYHPTMQRRIKKLYGYDFAARQEAIYQAMRDRLEAKWPEMLRRLETTDTSYRGIAESMDIGAETARRLIASKGYDMQARKRRIISNTNRIRNTRPRRKVDRVLPHSLPLNELWRAVA